MEIAKKLYNTQSAIRALLFAAFFNFGLHIQSGTIIFHLFRDTRFEYVCNRDLLLFLFSLYSIFFPNSSDSFCTRFPTVDLFRSVDSIFLFCL